MIHRHDTECNNKIRFYAKMTPSLFMGRKHTQIRIPENMMKGGLRGRNRSGRTTTTRPVNGIDQSVKLNRALWVLAEEMRRLKG